MISLFEIYDPENQIKIQVWAKEEEEQNYVSELDPHILPL